MARSQRMMHAAAVVLVVGGAMALAGPLDPPAGPVGSSGKTLVETEPRIAVGAATTPGSGTALYRITSPGSYYLTGNIAGAASRVGISIEASGVTLDLMGFDVAGVAGSLDGINAGAGTSDICVKNGTVRGWGGDGIDCSAATDVRLLDVRSSGNALIGLRTGENGVITGCNVRQNQGTGIVMDSGIVSDCSVMRNSANGMTVSACTVTRCTVSLNGSNGIACTSTVVEGCTVNSHGFDGIVAGSNCVLRNNMCDGNATSGTSGAGVHLTGTNSRVEGNNVTRAIRGIKVDGTNNYILRNTAAQNTVNFDVVVGNVILAVTAFSNTAAVSGSTGGTAPGSTDPSVNFAR